MAVVIGGWLGAVSLALATPQIFNASQTASPGESIYLQGDNFTVTPQVWFHRVLTTDTSLTPDVQLTPLTKTNQSITVNLPKNMPMGLYAVWVKDSGGTLSSPVFVNRARAMSFEYPAVPANYTFRIFGRNLFLAGATPTVTFVNGSNSYTAHVVTTYANTGYIMQVTAPSNLPTSGTYTVNVSNGYGHSTANYDIAASEETIQGRTGGSDPFTLGVPWGADFAAIAADVINVTTATNPHTSQPYTALNTVSGDWTNAIQQALYDAGNPTYHPNGATVYLPAGTYSINWSNEALQFYGPTGAKINQYGSNSTAHIEFSIPANAVLRGAGAATTTIEDYSPAYSGYSYFIVLGYGETGNQGSVNGSHSGVQGFTCLQEMTISDGTHVPDIRNGAANSTDIFFDHINIAFLHNFYLADHYCSCGDFEVQTGGNTTNVLMQNCSISGCTFGNANYYGQNWSYGSNYILRNNTILAWFRRLELIYMDHVIFENNHCTRDANFPPSNYGGTPTLGGVEFTNADCKLLGNTFDTVNVTASTPLPYENDGETFNSQGLAPAAAEPGIATGFTTTTLTDSSKSWPTNYFVGDTVKIMTVPTGGLGYGATGTITANTATSLTISAAWTATPSAGSGYNIETNLNFFDTGTVNAGGSTTTVTCTSSNPHGTWFPTTTSTYAGLAGQFIAIVNGPGAGQWRNIASSTSNSITVTQPWTEVPSTTSVYEVGYATSDHVFVVGNTMSGLPRGVALYCGSHDSAVANNLFENTGETIYERSSVRTSATAWTGRLDLSWNDVITDNLALDTTGVWSTTISAADYQGAGSATPGYMMLGSEFRRNILFSDYPSFKDGAIGLYEGYSNLDFDANTTYTNGSIASNLATIFDDNLAVDTATSNTSYPTFLNTDSYYTTFLNQLNLGSYTLTPQQYSDAKLPTSAPNASVGTSWNVDPTFVAAGFRGTGTSTGGTTDMVDTGGAATLIAGTGGNTMAIASTSPFIPGVTGDYLESSMVATGNAAKWQVTPTTSRTSWARIFDYRTGQWLVNGGFDFFWRPVTAVTTGNAFRPIDVGNNYLTHGLRLTFHNYNATTIMMEVITPTGGGGVAPTGTFTGGFTVGSIYHMGVTFSTNPTTGVTTAKIFAVAGTGAINTSVSTNLISTSTFTINPSIVTDDSGWLSGGVYSFGDSYGNSTVKTNDYDDFRMYSQDPGTFPVLN